ncbi:MAG: cell division protein FtsL [Lysobacterales bacterium]
MKWLGAALLLLLLLADIGSAVGVVYARHEGRRLFVQLSRLSAERDEMNFEFGRLQLEQSTWAEPSRIENVARNQFGMVSPGPADTVLISRGAPR